MIGPDRTQPEPVITFRPDLVPRGKCYKINGAMMRPTGRAKPQRDILAFHDAGEAFQWFMGQELNGA